MASNGVGSSRSSKGVKASSSSVDWLTRDLVEMRIRDKVETDDERVSLALPMSISMSWSSLHCVRLCFRIVNQILLMALALNLVM